MENSKESVRYLCMKTFYLTGHKIFALKSDFYYFYYVSIFSYSYAVGHFSGRMGSLLSTGGVNEWPLCFNTSQSRSGFRSGFCLSLLNILSLEFGGFYNRQVWRKDLITV